MMAVRRTEQNHPNNHPVSVALPHAAMPCENLRMARRWIWVWGIGAHIGTSCWHGTNPNGI